VERLPWRHGGHFPRHVYAQVGEEPSSVVDPYVGTLETRELAAEVIAAHNEALAGGRTREPRRREPLPACLSDHPEVQRFDAEFGRAD
jgi:hypothetical protein